MMQRVRILAFVIFATVAANAAQAQQASGFVELWNTVSEDKGITPQLNVLIQGPISGRIGWDFWGLTSEGWGEGLVGLTFAPSKSVAISVRAGIETDDAPLRESVKVWVGKNKISFLTIHEFGGSGYWYRHTVIYQAGKTWAVGIDSVRFIGTGPYIEKKIRRGTIWGTYAVTTNKAAAGTSFNF